jgi:hypothetical protein
MFDRHNLTEVSDESFGRDNLFRSQRRVEISESPMPTACVDQTLPTGRWFSDVERKQREGKTKETGKQLPATDKSSSLLTSLSACLDMWTNDEHFKARAR